MEKPELTRGDDRDEMWYKWLLWDLDKRKFWPKYAKSPIPDRLDTISPNLIIKGEK